MLSLTDLELYSSILPACSINLSLAVVNLCARASPTNPTISTAVVTAVAVAVAVAVAAAIGVIPVAAVIPVAV